MPTIADKRTQEGAPSGIGAFTSSMTGLSPSTTYYVRAYAVNVAGTAYGDEVTFTSLNQKVSMTIPTMNEWGIMILMILLGIGSIYYLRRMVAA